MDSLNRGDFRQRVEFKNVAKTQDDEGGHDEDYTTLLTTWAYVKTDGGSRDFNAGMDEIRDRKSIYVYYRSALSAVTIDTKLVYSGKEYKIEAWNMVDEEKKIMKYKVVA